MPNQSTEPPPSGSSESTFPADWTMPEKPNLAKECGGYIFGFSITPHQVLEMADKMGIDPKCPYSSCVDAVYERLMQDLPPAWRYTAFGYLTKVPGGPTITTKVLLHNTNANEEERDRLPDLESIKQVFERICAKDGPRWFKYARI
ncbi:hypothetical protein D9613_009060 [Agrocybe pediades]|uniref:Uncharacterized protein n=1 Tax=Agrocybe pediades TaxID=84607 RepID=A0A8H4R3A3_9AGAR|nr:hypothetical protein D9613_009060 [Agrocybe pediades]